MIDNRNKRTVATHGPGGLLSAVASLTVPAQAATDIARAPALTIERYQRDWSYLADPVRQTGRYIPLSKDSSVHLITGLEARFRYDSYRNVSGDLLRMMIISGNG